MLKINSRIKKHPPAFLLIKVMNVFFVFYNCVQIKFSLLLGYARDAVLFRIWLPLPKVRVWPFDLCTEGFLGYEIELSARRTESLLIEDAKLT